MSNHRLLPAIHLCSSSTVVDVDGMLTTTVLRDTFVSTLHQILVVWYSYGHTNLSVTMVTQPAQCPGQPLYCTQFPAVKIPHEPKRFGAIIGYVEIGRAKHYHQHDHFYMLDTHGLFEIDQALDMKLIINAFKPYFRTDCFILQYFYSPHAMDSASPSRCHLRVITHPYDYTRELVEKVTRKEDCRIPAMASNTGGLGDGGMLDFDTSCTVYKVLLT